MGSASSERVIRFGPNLRGTGRETLAPDLGAGLAVAALAIPQALAYALVAGVPPQMGLVAAAIPAALAALFGSSPYLVTGPTNPTALVIGAAVVAPLAVSGVAAGSDAGVTARVVGTGLLAGVLIAGFALAGLGRAARFVSDSVVAGFASGVGILIAIQLLPGLTTGPEVAPVASSSWAPRVWPLLVTAARAVASADARTLALALGVPALVLALRRVDRRIPGALIALGLAGFVVHLFDWDRGADPVAMLGTVPFGAPHLALPGIDDPAGLAPAAFAIAVLTTLQSIAAARSLGMRAGERFDPDRELLGQGIANVASAFLGGLATSGSLTRSALARSAGGRSRLAPLVSGLAIALLLPLLAPLLARLPFAALVGLVVLSGAELVNPRALRRAAATRGDALVLCATLAATLWIDLLQALYAGLFLSLALLVRRAGRLQMLEIVRARGRFREIPVDETTGTSPAVLLHLEGDLNFAVAPALTDRLSEIGARGPRVVVLRLKRAGHLDATLLEALRRAARELRAGGTTLVLCGLSDELTEMLAHTEFGAELGADGLLRAGTRMGEGLAAARAHARALLDARPDEAIFRQEPATDPGGEI